MSKSPDNTTDRPPKQPQGDAAAGIQSPAIRLSQADFADTWADSYSPKFWPDGFAWIRERGEWWEYSYRFYRWIPADERAWQTMRGVIEKSIEARNGSRQKWLKAVEISAALQIARRGRPEHRMTLSESEFDQAPDLIGLEGGQVVELQTGEVRRGEPQDMLSKALAPGLRLRRVGSRLLDRQPRTWERYLWEALGAYLEEERPFVLDWLQRFAGYCLTGKTHAEVFVFLFGPPGTGKSLFG